jgi:transposase
MYVGLDAHKEYCLAVCQDETGRKVREEKFCSTGPELQNFVNSLTQGDRVVMEACGAWAHIYDAFTERGIQVKLAHPLKTKAIASARIKTDRIDANILAHLLRANLIPEAWVPPVEIRELRTITRYRAGLVKLQTEVKNQVHALLMRNGIKHEFSDLFGKAGLEFLAGIDNRLNGVDSAILRSCMGTIGYLAPEIKRISDHIALLVKENADVKLLMTIPGISVYSAALIVAEIGDIRRFQTYKQLCSYAGIDPSVHSSGGTVRYGSITKQGSKLLRWILAQAVNHVIRRSGKLHDFYMRMVRRGKGKNVARVAAARKLLRVIWCMLIRREPFREESEQLTAMKYRLMKEQASEYPFAWGEVFQKADERRRWAESESGRFLGGEEME